MPIKRNVYIKSHHDHAVKQATALAARIAPERKGFDTVEEMLASVSKKSAAVTVQRETRYTMADAVAVFRTKWPQLHREHYPGTVPDVIMLNTHVPRIKRQLIEPLRDGDIIVSTFLVFLFENWTLCRHNRAFHKFKYYPPAPALDWLLKYSALYLHIFRDHALGFTVESEEVEKPAVEPKEDKAKMRRVVQAAQTEIGKRDREIAQLRAENKRLQTKAPRRITSLTATKPGKATPDW